MDKGVIDEDEHASLLTKLCKKLLVEQTDLTHTDTIDELTSQSVEQSDKKEEE